MKKEKSKSNYSGEVRVKVDKVFWDYDNEEIFQIDLKDVVVIGEHTNSDGPWFDDWFLDFVTRDGLWWSIPMYAANIDEILIEYLTKRFNYDFTKRQLANSTDWKSVVHYPTRLKGEPLFFLTPTATYREPKNFFERFLYGLGIGNFDTNKDVNLTAEVKNELVNANRKEFL